MKTNNEQLKQRIQRFVRINHLMREATLASEREFLQLAGNISAAQLQLILAIGSQGKCTMSQLAQSMHFSQANVTQMINRLISKNFVKRHRCQVDKRVSYVSLLSKGKKVCQLHQEHIERTVAECFSKMSENEQEQMLSFWEKFILAKIHDDNTKQ
jgi:DNA-binding MarR family transcriptional regulator